MSRRRVQEACIVCITRGDGGGPVCSDCKKCSNHFDIFINPRTFRTIAKNKSTYRALVADNEIFEDCAHPSLIRRKLLQERKQINKLKQMERHYQRIEANQKTLLNLAVVQMLDSLISRDLTDLVVSYLLNADGLPYLVKLNYRQTLKTCDHLFCSMWTFCCLCTAQSMGSEASVNNFCPPCRSANIFTKFIQIQ